MLREQLAESSITDSENRTLEVNLFEELVVGHDLREASHSIIVSDITDLDILGGGNRVVDSISHSEINGKELINGGQHASDLAKVLLELQRLVG